MFVNKYINLLVLRMYVIRLLLISDTLEIVI